MSQVFRLIKGRKILRLDTSDVGRANYLNSKGVTTGGSGGAGTQQALIAASISGLGAGPFADGQTAVIRIGTYPDTEYVQLIRDGVNNRWVSDPFTLISMTDVSYMGVNTTVYSYVGQNVSGTLTGGIGFTTKPIRRSVEMFAAGLKLQYAMSGILQGPAAAVSVTCIARFFQNSDGETVPFSSDGSTASAETQPLVSPATNAITFKAATWSDVLKFGTGNPLAAADFTKPNLWPRLYGRVLSGTSYGGIIDIDLAVRWVA
jgi:hypothetical protein